MGTQPAVPPLAPLTPIEQAYIDESPANLFPENQDSNFGLKRKNFCDVLDNVSSQLDLLYNERWPNTSSDFISYHENQAGVPVNPPILTLAQRQQLVEIRYLLGPFTPLLRNAIIEYFISLVEVPGSPPAFLTSGVSLAGGIPLFASAGPLTMYYVVVEDVENFSYAVYIDSSVNFDLVGLSRELTRITPAGITFKVFNYLPYLVRKRVVMKKNSSSYFLKRLGKGRRRKPIIKAPLHHLVN